MEKRPYLPRWATLDEAENWLEELTGEVWPLPRLLEFGVWPSVWVTPPPARLRPDILERVFNGKREGFLAPLCFAGDTTRLGVDRQGSLTMTRTEAGELVQFTPGIAFALADLRFAANALSELAERVGDRAPKLGEQLKRRALVQRFSGEWTSIKEDLAEASRNGLNSAKLGGGLWDVLKALEWAKQQGKLNLIEPSKGSSWHPG